MTKRLLRLMVVTVVRLCTTGGTYTAQCRGVPTPLNAEGTWFAHADVFGSGPIVTDTVVLIHLLLARDLR